MAPPSVDFAPQDAIDNHVNVKNGSSTNGLVRAALKYSGFLDEYESFDVTAVIGREFPKAQLSKILEDDKKIRDLAITGTLLQEIDR